MREGHAVGEFGVGFRVAHRVGDLGEEGLPCADALRLIDGLCEVEVGGVRAAAKGVENEQVESFEQRVGLVGYPAAIGAVGHLSDAKTEDRHLAVEQGDWRHRDLADGKWRAVDHAPFQLRSAGRIVSARLERVRKHPPQRGEGLLGRVTRDRPAHQVIEPPKVVEAGDVVGVMMRVEHRIHAVDVVGETLQAKLGRGVDQDVRLARTNPNAWAGALVPRIIRRAYRALAPDHRHPVRRAGAQNHHFDGRHHILSVYAQERPSVNGVASSSIVVRGPQWAVAS